MERAGRLERPGGAGDHVRAHGLRRDARLPPAAHPSLVPDVQAGRVPAGLARLDGGAGAGDDLGRRPPQAPRAHRPGGRSALAARARRRAQGRAAGALPRAHGLALRPRRHGRARALRQGPPRGPRHARHPEGLPPAGARRLRAPVPARLGDRRHARRRPHRRAVGRLRADLPAPPRDVVDQLRLPLLRHAPLRRRRPLDQRLLALPPLVRRVLAPQPPRVPALRRPRPASAGSSTRRRGSSGRCGA